MSYPVHKRLASFLLAVALISTGCVDIGYDGPFGKIHVKQIPFRGCTNTTMKILDVPQSGSQAGTTASRNRFGQYRRTRATPVNTNSTAQQAARNRLSAASEAWRGLTDAQREAWNSFADEHPQADSLGQIVTLSGHQFYVGVICALAAGGYAAVTTPDSTAPGSSPAVGASTLTVAGFSVVFGTNPVPAGEALLLESSPPLSQGRSFNGDFRLVKVRAAAAASSLVKADMEAKFGTLIAGQKFFLRASYITSTGVRSAYGTATVIVT